jgi:folate-binding protein YgfZ
MTNAINKDYITNITNKGVIQLTGEERVKYLQGQVTADINKLSPENVLLACHCDFKGKIWSVFHAFSWKDTILLVTHESVLAKSLAELNKYGVFAKVEITDASSNWIITAGQGAEFEAAITNLFGKLPVGDKNSISNEIGIVTSISSPVQRYLVLQPVDAENKLEMGISNQQNRWEVDDIKAGLGDIRASSINEYVPQMLNLQILDAINFEKGRYMGQEVVARTKYLGRNKRAGFILKTDLIEQDLTGEQLEYQIGDNWRPGGKVLRSGSDFEQTWAFAVLSNETAIGSNFRVKSQPDIILQTQALPYNLE